MKSNQTHTDVQDRSTKFSGVKAVFNYVNILNDPDLM